MTRRHRCSAGALARHVLIVGTLAATLVIAACGGDGAGKAPGSGGGGAGQGGSGGVQASGGVTGAGGAAGRAGTGGAVGSAGRAGASGGGGGGHAGGAGGSAGTGGTAAGAGGHAQGGGAGGHGGGAGGTTGSGGGGHAGSGAGGTAGAGAVSGAGGSGTYGGCRFIGDVDRVLIAKRDADSGECVVLVMSQRGGPSGLQLTMPPGWGVEFAFTMPATAVTCLLRFPSSDAIRADGGSGTVTFDPAKLSSISADVTLTFSAGDSSGAATAALKADDVDITGNCP